MTDECTENYVHLFNPNLLRDKVAFITGGGSGIGFTIAEIFMRHGCDTVIASRDVNKLRDASAKLAKGTGRKCRFVALDVRKPQEILAAVDTVLSEFGRIDIVVNNAAGNFLCPLSGMSFNAFKVVMEIDAHGTFNVSKSIYDKYLKEHGGVILNVSATLPYKGQIMQAHAGAAKAAIDALTKHMAVEWGGSGIRVVGVAPGPIDNTVGLNKLAGKAAFNEVKSLIPLQRIGTRLDVAHAALFLVADTGSYITGHTLVVDGGSWMTSHNNFAVIENRLHGIVGAAGQSTSKL